MGVLPRQKQVSVLHCHCARAFRFLFNQGCHVLSLHGLSLHGKRANSDLILLFTFTKVQVQVVN